MEYVVILVIFIGSAVAAFFAGRSKSKPEETFEKKKVLPSPKKHIETTEAEIEKATSPNIDIRTKLERLRERAKRIRDED